MGWILIIGLGSGWGTISSVQIVPMASEAQCRAAVEWMMPPGHRGPLAVACVGPDGQIYAGGG